MIFDPLKDLMSERQQTKTLRRWDAAVEASDRLDVDKLTGIASKARQQRAAIDRFLFEADGRLTEPVLGSNTIPKPMYCDWAYRPQLWRGPVSPTGLAGVENHTTFGDEATFFHDCPLREMSVRQVRNTRPEDQAPFGLSMDVIGFEGSFLSMVVELPEDAAAGLSLGHVMRLDMKIAMEQGREIFARLNVKHGPNTDQIVRELPMDQDETWVEFDLAYSKINEKQMERMWLDLIFERPAMNKVTIRDLTLTRRPRADL